MLDNLNLREEVVNTQDDHIPESVLQELDYWEKAVFSFDMDRSSNTGPPSSSTGTNDAVAQRETTERRRRDSARHPNPSSAALGSEGAPLSDLQNATLLQLLNMQAQEGIQRPPSLPPPVSQHSSQSGMLDPYTLAHLASIGALVSPGATGSSAQPANNPSNQNDPYAILRQVQSLLYPYGLSSGANHPSPPNLSQAYPTVQQPVPSRAIPGDLQSQPIHRQRSLGSPAASWAPFSGSSQIFPPIDPALTAQYPHLSPALGHSQSAGAGPSSAVNINRRSPSLPAGSPTNPQSHDETAIAEDKRRRNTAASGKKNNVRLWYKLILTACTQPGSE